MTYDERALQRILARTLATPKCWLWQGATTRTKGKGLIYGQIGYNGRLILVHRLAYQLLVASPGALLVLHKCDTPLCWRPSHLFLGTHQINAKDRDAKQRGQLPNNRGERHGMAKLSEPLVAAMRREASEGDSIDALAIRYRVRRETVRSILTRKRWKHVA